MGNRFGRHRGYPGAYGEGLVALWARDSSATALVDAVCKRCTYGVTGDRVQLNFFDTGFSMQLDATAQTVAAALYLFLTALW
jgi:hypothetical protein